MTAPPMVELGTVIGVISFPWSRWNPIPPSAGPDTPRQPPEAEGAVVPENAAC